MVQWMKHNKVEWVTNIKQVGCMGSWVTFLFILIFPFTKDVGAVKVLTIALITSI